MQMHCVPVPFNGPLAIEDPLHDNRSSTLAVQGCRVWLPLASSKARTFVSFPLGDQIRQGHIDFPQMNYPSAYQRQPSQHLRASNRVAMPVMGRSVGISSQGGGAWLYYHVCWLALVA